MPVKEPAIDLAICVAIASAASKRPVRKDVACFGEVSLLGEVRPVNAGDRRTNAASKMGSKVVVAGPRQGTDSVKTLRAALEAALEPASAEISDEVAAEAEEESEARAERRAHSAAVRVEA
jgi:DNA repair protein RadA/Sms